MYQNCMKNHFLTKILTKFCLKHEQNIFSTGLKFNDFGWERESEIEKGERERVKEIWDESKRERRERQSKRK